MPGAARTQASALSLSSHTSIGIVGTKRTWLLTAHFQQACLPVFQRTQLLQTLLIMHQPSFPFTAAANNTWWNIRSASGTTVLPLPSCDYGALETFVLGAVGPPASGNWSVGPVVLSKSLTSEPAELSAGSSAAAGAAAAGAAPNATVDAAAAAPPYSLFPGYCASRVGWWVEQVRPRVALYPPDLHSAMVATRGQRLPGGQARL